MIDKGDSVAMTRYAGILLDGKLVEQNIDELIKYFKMAVDRGDTSEIDYYTSLICEVNNINDNEKWIKMMSKLMVCLLGDFTVLD